jgi:hypothetical protein
VHRAAGPSELHLLSAHEPAPPRAIVACRRSRNSRAPYVIDQIPGIRREKGRRADLARIRALAIPPAWTDGPCVDAAEGPPRSRRARSIETVSRSGYRFRGDVTRLVDMTATEPALSIRVADREPSIAVLPFANVSADAENEYFSDGVTEEIIHALAQIRGFKVIARTSAFAFKNRTEDVRRIGNLLDVSHVVEGSVRKSGERIR